MKCSKCGAQKDWMGLTEVWRCPKGCDEVSYAVHSLMRLGINLSKEQSIQWKKKKVREVKGAP